jgi:putative transposase
MGIRLLFAKPYSPEATGKAERFNRVVDSFLAEAILEEPPTLERLNQLFAVWLEECYQNKPHSGLAGNISPQTAYRSDRKALNFLDPETIASAFLHCEERKVDKAGCISFAGKKYEVGLTFIGCKVDVIYDPADISQLTIEYEGHQPFKAKELVIGERSAPRPKLPEHLQKAPADSSRLLNAAARKNQERKESQPPCHLLPQCKKRG